MGEWKLYAARGFMKDGRFNPKQLDEAISIGLHPQLVLYHSNIPRDVLSDLGSYLKMNKIDNSPISVISHGNGTFSDDLEKVEKTLEYVVDLNKKAGRPLLTEVNFHAGSFRTMAGEEREKKLLGLSDLDSSIGAEEYLLGFNKIKMNLIKYTKQAKADGIDLIIENVGQVTYIVTRRKNTTKIPDKRWGSCLSPGKFQMHAYGCVKELGEITDGNLCIDIEHMEQSYEYAKRHIHKGVYAPKDSFEKRVLEKFNLIIEKGKPLLYHDNWSPYEAIRDMGNRIKTSHLGGQTSMFIKDGDTTMIGSHYPIAFENDDVEWIKNKSLMRKLGKIREKKVTKYLRALHDAGCRKGVFELHMGQEYVGPRWRKYSKMSKKNVESILRTL